MPYTTCDECGGKGVDVGSLHEPEPCTICKGAGVLAIEGIQRKPIQRATLPHPMTAGQFAEYSWVRGER